MIRIDHLGIPARGRLDAAPRHAAAAVGVVQVARQRTHLSDELVLA
jgi:hypothetical protein